MTPPPFITAAPLDLPGIRHGYFGRRGGVSSGVLSSLNVGFGAQDTQGNVEQNRARVADALGTSAPRLLSCHQFHSADVLTVNAPFSDGPRPMADGLVTATPGLAIGALAADCAPVLFADPKARVIGACHAGWGGAFKGITDSTLSAMQQLGASRDHIIAVVGPCISQKNYEVGPEFLERFLAQDAGHARFFAKGHGDHSYFDLKAYVVHRLTTAGVLTASALPDCTYAAPDHYFSYRYNTHQGIIDYGRQISAIMIDEA